MKIKQCYKLLRGGDVAHSLTNLHGSQDDLSPNRSFHARTFAFSKTEGICFEATHYYTLLYVNQKFRKVIADVRMPELLGALQKDKTFESPNVCIYW